MPKSKTNPTHASDDTSSPIDPATLSLSIGLPIAFVTRDCELLPQSEDVPGSGASIKCKCGSLFLLDLRDERIQRCPDCKAKFTYVLLVAAPDDDDVIDEFLSELAAANGLQPAEPEQNPDDEGDDDDAGDDAGDDEGDDDDAGDDEGDDEGDDDEDEDEDDDADQRQV